VVLITSTREGFPVSVMEAMAQGVVPLCTRVGGIPGQIRDGVNGVLIDPQPDDVVVEQCVSKLGKLAAHRGMVNAMGRAAHGHALEHFAMERFAQQWREVMLPGAAPGASP
jgi:glycosyltransferase involved in cell wall biosynthesis